MKEIPLSKGQVAIVDNEDFEYLLAFKWHAVKDSRSNHFYAVRSVKGEHIRMTSDILGPLPAGMEVDHINGDTLLNIRKNLRLATRTQQQRNRRLQKNNKSGFKGVDQIKGKLPWRAKIKVNWQQYTIGHFQEKEEAARAYDQRARELFGEFAVLNFPSEQLQG